MEKEKLFNMSEEATKMWNSCSFGMEIPSNELNYASEQQLPNCFYNPNWDNSLDQSDPFESALSSIVSSPVASNANNVNPIPTSGVGGAGNDTVIIRELIGRLGSICNSGDISPNSYINNNNNSTNTSCYSTPLNSPPKLNLSMIDSQIRGNLPILGNNVSNHQGLEPFPADPGFAERAARYSCFGGMNLGGGFNLLFGLNESELPHRLVPRETGKLSRVSGNHSMKILGTQQVDVQDNQKNYWNSDKQANSRPSTPEKAEVGDSREESSVSEQIPVGESAMKSQNESNARKRKAIPRGKAKETPSSSPSASEAKVSTENDQASSKGSKSSEENGSDKAKEEQSGSQKQNKENLKLPEPPKDYIHVRARRNQATDSHSLAERVRREKISERMKFLQDLVPGCNKVTGKAVMLDEIINYVQSLQRQVEFLSMKLATVNPKIDFNMEAVLPKNVFQSRGSMNHFPLDSTAQAFPCSYQSQQGMPLQNGMAGNADITQFSMNQLNSVLRRNPSLQLPPLDGLGDTARQVPTFWEDDLQSVVQMGFGQNQQTSIQRSMPTAQMKVEL